MAISPKLDALWREQGRMHGGIIASHDLAIGHWIDRVRRAGTRLSPELARGQFMVLDLFANDDIATAVVISLGDSA
ncbi:MAG TPA: hypothetical protein VF157_05060 [Chloroflexota bacterium]